MATREEVIEEISDLTKKATDTHRPDHALQLAQAAASMAETRAWLISPSQPHGGTVLPSA
ncbi:hypothetical protein M3697_05390 [Janibacter melonis]|uniref:hypothetical protein n=1 Tax=Janibacter melonis TaxID=262209 RepID=UPI0020440C78|nr:hypothetical protein [Janibacter melonis]MCM3554539.1 hypothetical protein [Janibacter melonis]